MRSAHDEARAAQIRSVHCPTVAGWRRVCAACGQSWPCTDYSWAAGDPAAWTLREVIRFAAVLVVLGVVMPGAAAWLLPPAGWTVLLALWPLAVLGALLAAGWHYRRRSR